MKERGPRAWKVHAGVVGLTLVLCFSLLATSTFWASLWRDSAKEKQQSKLSSKHTLKLQIKSEKALLRKNATKSTKTGARYGDVLNATMLAQLGQAGGPLLKGVKKHTRTRSEMDEAPIVRVLPSSHLHPSILPRLGTSTPVPLTCGGRGPLNASLIDSMAKQGAFQVPTKAPSTKSTASLKSRSSMRAPTPPTFSLIRAGGHGCASVQRQAVKVLHENSDPDPEYPNQRSLTPRMRALVNCLYDIRQCNSQTTKSARALAGIRLLLEGPKGKGAMEMYNGTNRLRVDSSGREGGKAFKSCALVGNAGHLLLEEHGPQIDRHEVVMRFNRQKVTGHESHVGARTTHRVVNLSDGMALCCRRVLAEAKLDADNPWQRQWPLLMFWHAALQDDIMMKCRKKFPSPTYGFTQSYVDSQVRVFKALRRDLLELGTGPFDPWKQMTSGAHGLLMAVPLCDSISMYGFTTYPRSTIVKDQYAGNAMRSRSGTVWHDWTGEQMVWRLLHAAGIVNICSM